MIVKTVLLHSCESHGIETILYLLFVILEFGIYSIIINKENKKRILAYFALFAIVPTFYLGKGLDLGNRATIPILILLYLEISKKTFS